jgi:hypothetical protein
LGVADEVHHVLRRLHRFHEGVLGMGEGASERIERTHFVIDPVSGRPVFPAPKGLFEQESLTLHAPDDEPGALMILGRAEELDPLRDGACDRWQFYHGKPRLARWAALEIESIKSTDHVLDQRDAQVQSPLLAAEPSLCRWVNTEHKEAMREACRRSLGTLPESALLVGVDPYGLDVRAQFGVMRVEFPGVAETEAAARAAIEELLRA